MGNLLEFGGEADVILRAICDFSVNGIDYKKDDVVLMLNGVSINITYNETIKDRTVGGRNFIAYDERKLNAMLIKEVSLSSDFIQLFAEKTASSFLKPVVENNVTISDDMIFYPTAIPAENTVFIVGLGQRSIQYDENNNYAIVTLEPTDITLNKDFTIIYSTKIISDFYDINNNYTLPYFKAQICSVGNINKAKGNTYIEIPRVSLLTKPDYSMENSVVAQELAFKIINDSRTDKIELGVY